MVVSWGAYNKPRINLSAVECLDELKIPGYVAFRIVFMVFIEVDLISYIALVFPKAVVDLSRGFADVEGLSFGADNAVDKTG